MNANINADELRLLAYLHEHAEGYGPRYHFDISEVAKALGADVSEIRKSWSYLAEHGLAGMVMESRISGGATVLETYEFLTGAGENFMRALEAEPGIARKVTVGVVKEMGKVLQDIAVSILTGFVNGRLNK